jgi:hypothetical protein
LGNRIEVPGVIQSGFLQIIEASRRRPNITQPANVARLIKEVPAMAFNNVRRFFA